MDRRDQNTLAIQMLPKDGKKSIRIKMLEAIINTSLHLCYVQRTQRNIQGDINMAQYLFVSTNESQY